MTFRKFSLRGTTVVLREAETDDVTAIVALLADDQLGETRDGIENDSDTEAYLNAFRAIEADPSHLLLVATDQTDVIATLQLSFLPGLAHRGALRAHIEAVRVREDYRDHGLGAAIIGWAIEEARRRGCALVQLSSDKSRTAAHRFYERLGFTATHQGLKLKL